MHTPDSLSGHELFDVTQELDRRRSDKLVSQLGNQTLLASLDAQKRFRDNPMSFNSQADMLAFLQESDIEMEFFDDLNSRFGNVEGYTIRHFSPGELMLAKRGDDLFEETTIYADARDDAVDIRRKHSYIDITDKPTSRTSELPVREEERVILRTTLQKLKEILGTL